MSVRGRVWGTEDECEVADLEDHIVKWPGVIPKRAQLKNAAPKSVMRLMREPPMRVRGL